MTHFATLGKFGLLLEAEVPTSAQPKFEKHYNAAAGIAVTPGSPKHYQNQPNKRAAELRVYFNDPGMAVLLEVHGVHVEYPRRGYKSGQFRYRFNDNKLWWKLVEIYGLRLGVN
jgi:hypothetical protein